MKNLYFNKSSFYFILLILALSSIWFVSGTSEERRIILPCITLLNMSVYFWCVLWDRSKKLPVLDVGSMLVAACLLYTLIPAIGFLSSNMLYNNRSSLELFVLAPKAEDLEPLIWQYVTYAISFEIVYLYFHKCGLKEQVVETVPSKIVLLSIGCLIVVTEIGFLVLRFCSGFDITSTYDRINDTFSYLYSLPLIVQQILGNVIIISFLFKMYFIVLLIASQRKRNGQIMVILCVLAILSSYFSKVGSRTETVVLLMSCGLAYHRFVKPIGLRLAIFSGVFLIATFMLMGFMRGGADMKTNFAQLKFMTSGNISLLSIANEFQILFGCTYDWFLMQKTGILGEIPLQFHFYDILLLIPSQLLPFEKINPTLWYWKFSNTKGFFSFNPIAQSIIGINWIELILRGSILGWMFARIHSWYLRRSSSFWMNFFYIFMVVWSYYSIKSSTFIWIYFVLYRFIPATLIIYLIISLVSHRRSTLVNAG